MRGAESGSSTNPRLIPRIAKAAAAAVVLASVAVAFADSSIVVLALPDLLEQFDVSIGSVAWVVTAYNLVLAIAALALVRVAPRLDAARLGLVGGVTFLVASLACAVAPSVWPLVAFRAVQGLGAALLLLGALPLTRALASTPARGSALWTGAGVFGAALGPALGGMLTEIFSWRAIFFAQAPIAALEVAVVLCRRAPVREETLEHAGGGGRSRQAAGVALALASAALVGLLFLAVVQLIDVWRLSPFGAGAVVTVIPLATLVAAPFAASAGVGAVAAGSVLLAGGLAGMAFLPAHNLAWVIAALTISGLGYGLLVPSLARSALPAQGSPAASGAMTLWVRHAGLVAGLLILTPLLSSDLSAAGERAKLRGISVALDAPVSAGTKLRLAIDLAPVLSVPTRKGLPNFTEALASERAPPVTGLGHGLDSIVQATVTRGFRRSFVLTALFALLAATPIAFASRRQAGRRRRALRAPAAALLTAGALVGAELAGGAIAYGARPRLLPSCAHRQAPATHGADAEAQRIVLAGLDLIACRLHATREELVADLARRGVDGAELAARIERYAKLIHLPGRLGG